MVLQVHKHIRLIAEVESEEDKEHLGDGVLVKPQTYEEARYRSYQIQYALGDDVLSFYFACHKRFNKRVSFLNSSRRGLHFNK